MFEVERIYKTVNIVDIFAIYLLDTQLCLRLNARIFVRDYCKSNLAKNTFI